MKPGDPLDTPRLYSWTNAYSGPLTNDGNPEYYERLEDLGNFSTVYAKKNVDRGPIYGASANRFYDEYAQTYPKVTCPSYYGIKADRQGPAFYLKEGQTYSFETNDTITACESPYISRNDQDVYYVSVDPAKNDNSCQKFVCEYDPKEFRFNDAAVALYAQQNGWNHKIMGEFCSQEGAICPNSSGNYPTCSRFVSQDFDGQLCREWSQEGDPSDPQSAAYISNAIMKKWAQDHTDTANPMDERYTDPTCGCINRQLDPAYNQLKSQAQTANDGCWYKPCSPGSVGQFLIPYTERNVDATGCSAVCEQFATIGDNVTVSNSVIDEILTCGDWTRQKNGDDNDNDNDNNNSDELLTMRIKQLMLIGGITFIGGALILILKK